MDFPDPGELERAARHCEVQAARLQSTIGQLRTLKNGIFGSWTGNAAQSLDTAVGTQVIAIEAAEADLGHAARALRLGAQDVRAALQREEQERARRAAGQRRGDQRRGTP